MPNRARMPGRGRGPRGSGTRQQAGEDLDALADLCTPWCVHVVATLGVAEHLEAGPRDIDELADAAGCDGDALARVLRHLIGKGVFEEPGRGRFALNPAARGLLDPSRRLGLDLDGFGGRMAMAWGSLLGAVRTGRTMYHETFGLPFWDDLDAHPDLAASFDALMGPPGHGVPDPEILLNEDWASVRTVVDVAGGTGALLAQILRTRPDVRGTLVELPRTLSRAAETFRAAGVADRVTTVERSFFDPLPAGADLYVLKSVLSDWPDPQAEAILRRCAQAAQPDGRVVVVGGVAPDPGGDDLLMLVLVGGKDRSISEFVELARRAGLMVTAAGRPRSGRFIVECRPAPG